MSAAFVEKVWFDEAVARRPRAETGELAEHCGHADILREQIINA